ncbi:MAG: tetratricopeptide repeat protein [Bacteroidales bacterium]|nr:tetratricopeptide repeat protein [Bacteroidales bacterium]
MIYKLLLTTLVIFSLNLRSQNIITLQEIEYGGLILIEIKNFPENQLPKGCTEALLLYDSESEKFSFLGRQNENAFRIIDEMQDVLTYNQAKAYADVEFSENKIKVCSEMPFRATSVCNIFEWNGSKFSFKDTEETDPSWDNVQKGEEFLEKGMIKEAVEAFQDVFYPHAYMDEKDVALRLLYKAHEIALSQYQKKDYAGAVETMKTAFEYWYFDFNSVNEMEEELSYNEKFSAKKIISIYGDYGLFLLKNKDYQLSVDISKKAISLDSESPGPYLQLGDGLFALNKTPEAKEIYLKYKDLMTKSGKESKIPTRVNERLK